MDCRWLGIGGPGRTTELALRGLATAPPPGRWILWGPAAATTALAWAGADVRPIARDPRLALGQRDALAVPRGDFYVFMHQQRPLRPLPAVTVIYDTIAVRYGARPAVRALRRSFLRAVARSSRRILTISEHSRASIVRELRVPDDRVDILRFPFDDAFVGRVMARRRSSTPVEAALFVGGFLPHKNLPRLLLAFGATSFRKDGGRLVLVAATAGQADEMLGSLSTDQRAFVDVRHSCSQADLDELFASVRFVVQPSLEEGFGLPAWEAMCCGVPVCVSDGGALPEVVGPYAEPFPAESVPAITEAIDATAAAARAQDTAARDRQVEQLRATAPTIAQFGARFHAAVARGAQGRP